MRRLSITVLFIAGGIASTNAVARSTTPPDLPKNTVICSTMQPSNSPQGVPARLAGRTAYQATAFPIPVRLTMPDGTWSGGQWKTGSTGCRIDHFGIGMKPYYGWVAVGHGSTPGAQRGSILLMTSYGSGPSVASVVANLRKLDKGVSYQQPVQVKVSGLAGSQLDGMVGAVRHTFFVFTKPGAAAGAHADGVDMAQGTSFRILVLDAHGKTVVVYIASGSLAATAFPGFLASAQRVLEGVSFPSS